MIITKYYYNLIKESSKTEQDKMIRNYREIDLDKMVEIWYNASVIAHSFIPDSFWGSQKKEMKEKYFPLAENFVFEKEGQVLGFISLVGNKVCALFVSPEAQGRGTGKALLKYAKALKGKLSLKVYKENEKTLQFYRNCGFIITEEGIDEYTGCLQFSMKWE